MGQGPKQWMNLGAALRDDPAFPRQFLTSPDQAANVRDTIAPTVLSGGSAINVIPQTAMAEIDCRLLPKEDPEQFLRTINKVINDDSIKVEPVLMSKPTS